MNRLNLFHRRISASLCCLAIAIMALLFTPIPLLAEPVNIIFDTDMANDCDDAGALAVLNELANRGEAKMLAVIVNRKDAAGVSAASCDAINTFYGNGDVPIATDKDGAKFRWNKASSYTTALAKEFPHDCPADIDCEDAVDLYRRTLAAAEDQSVVICSVGALSNLEDLLNSKPDQHSPLDGAALVEAKVQHTVIMAGHFPRSSKPETNVRLDPGASVTIVHRWPGEIIWQGYEVGAVIHCGQSLQSTGADNPVRRAFELRPYLDEPAIKFGKPAHDQACVLIAVRGVELTYWKLSEPGRVVIDSDGHSQWYPDRQGKHRYVSMIGRPDRLEKLIDDLMVGHPAAIASASEHSR